MKIEQILLRVTVAPLFIAAVLLPSFFLPITSEWLEWNKHYLLGILVAISLLAWLARGLITKKLTVTRSPLDLPLVVWWVVLLVSAILAKDTIAGFFGHAGNVSWSFLAFTFYALFALLILWNIRSEDALGRLVDAFGIGMGLPALYFWLQKLGLLGWLPGPQSNVAASLFTALGVLQVFLLVLALGLLVLPKLSRKRTTLWGILAGLAFITILTFGFNKLWLAAAIGFVLVLIFAFPRLGEIRYPVVSSAMVGLVLAIVFLVMGTPGFLTVQTGAEVTLAHGRSLQIAVDTMKEGAAPLIFGSGPGTFVYDFSAHRPESFNLHRWWSVRFSRPVASSYQLLAETGVLGVLVALATLLVGLGLVWQLWSARRKRAAGAEMLSGYAQALSGLWLMALIMLFLVAYGTTLWFVFMTGFALLVLTSQLLGVTEAKSATLSMKISPQYALASSFIYIVVVVLLVLGGIFLGRFYAADVLAVRGARAAAGGQFESSERLLAQATRLDPYRAQHQLRLAQAYLGHAALEVRTGKSEPQRIGALVANAINASRRATGLAPLSVASWEQLAQMYANARGLATEANQWVLTSLESAIALEPTNPRLYAQRGIAYRLMPGQEAQAQAEFERAVALKPNYAPAHYQLSILKEGTGDLAGAITAAGDAVRHAPNAIDAKFNLARLLYNRNQENDWEGAERLYRNILSQNPDHANTLYSLGVLLERKGAYAEAARLYEHALELDVDAEIVRRRLDELPAGTPRRVAPEPVAEEEIEEEGAEEAVGE